MLRKLTTGAVAVAALLLMAAELDDCSTSIIDDKLGQTAFTDLPKNHPFYAGVRVSEAEGWFAGYPDGRLKPDEKISSDQIATVTGRLFPDGATRAEVATFLAEGSIALRQHAIDIEHIDATNQVVISNSSSLRFVMTGWVLNLNHETHRTFTETAILAPLRTLTLDVPAQIASTTGNVDVTSVSLQDQYGLTVASD